MVEINGERVSLRDWSEGDFAVLPGLLAPERDWHRTNAPYFGEMTAGDVAAWVDDLRKVVELPEARRPRPRRSLAVVDRGRNTLVGMVSWYWESEATDWRRMGIVLYDESVWGAGFGTEAFWMWTTYLFASTDALRLDFSTFSGNAAMLALGRKLGFTTEAVFRKARRWSGGVHDSIVMGMLREEWQHRPR